MEDISKILYESTIFIKTDTYGDEINFFSNEITTDNKFKLENDNIYFVGDGTGKAGNIVASATTGLIAS